MMGSLVAPVRSVRRPLIIDQSLISAEAWSVQLIEALVRQLEW